MSHFERKKLLDRQPYTSREHMDYVYGVEQSSSCLAKYHRNTGPCGDNPNCFEGFVINNLSLGDVDDILKKKIGEDPQKMLKSEQKYVGIKNLGATCYMGSLIQTLYFNKVFRAGMYRWQKPKDNMELDGKEEICVQLQNIFTNLQKGDAKHFNPELFAKSCNIKTASQEDAQEFFKLLITFLEEGQGMQELIKSLFQGEYLRQTECLECGNKTNQKDEFYELDLNIENKTNLSDCIAEHFNEETLSGYACDKCSKKDANAKRTLSVLKFPPVLNVQLLRFVYDVGTKNKKKLFHKLAFEKTLDASKYSAFTPSAAAPATNDTSSMSTDDKESGSDGSGVEEAHKTVRTTNPNKVLYDLTAVLCHIGYSAYGGHYIAYIYDTTEESWYKFNDSDVTRCLLHNPFENDEHEYMLIYKKRDYLKREMAIAEPEPPPELVENVKKANSELAEAAKIYNEKKENEEMLIREINRMVSEIERNLACNITEKQYNWISLEWLRKWFSSKNKSDVGEINNEDLVCEHKKLKLDLAIMRRIRPEAWESLVNLYTGGPTLTQDDMCPQCTLEEFESYKSQNDEERRKELIRNKVETMSSRSTVPHEYFISESWYKAWEGSSLTAKLPGDPIFDLLCPHNQLRPEASKKGVNGEVWRYFIEKYPLEPNRKEITKDTQPCRECLEIVNRNKELDKDEKARRANEARTFEALGRRPQSWNIPPGSYYLVSMIWKGEWDKYVELTSNPHPGPLDNTHLLCRHKKLIVNVKDNFDLSRGNTPHNILDEATWRKLVQVYGIANPETTIVYTVDNYQAPSCSVDYCKVCEREISLSKTESMLHFNAKSIKISERGRSYPIQTEIHNVSSSTTLYNLKLMIMERMDIPLDSIWLFKDDDPLLDDALTLKDYKIKPDDVLEYTKVIDGNEDFVVTPELSKLLELDAGFEKPKEEGFTGTNLMGDRTKKPNQANNVHSNMSIMDNFSTLHEPSAFSREDTLGDFETMGGHHTQRRRALPSIPLSFSLVTILPPGPIAF
eukprot:TRINITY_DN7633_c0_g1_i2.p1 TRINITY_DN7633_c0_g1~~TRINITY_DN7633_c0_g1_i2.p1  ORF type:complete len:1019 (-),score=151.37 TRINITY_DN7633_c0_g1_i2:53-3109(-)